MSQEFNPAVMLAAVQVMLKVLSERAALFVALLMAFGLFSWAMWRGDWPGLAVAIAFGGIVFLPILTRTLRAGANDASQRIIE